MKERTINKNRKNLDDFDTFLQDNDQNNIEELQGKNRLKTSTETETVLEGEISLFFLVGPLNHSVVTYFN